DRLDRAGFVLLLATVLLTGAPLVGAGPQLQTDHAGPLGPGAGLRIAELFAFLTAAITLLSRSNARNPRPLALALAAFTGIVLLGALQLLPLPENWLQSLAPMNAAVYHAAREALGAFGARGPSPRISLAPSETLDALLLLLACGALWLAAARLLHDRGRRR